MTKQVLFPVVFALVVLTGVGCSTSVEEQAAAKAATVQAAVNIIVAAGTPMPTWTPIPPTLTPKPTLTPTPLPTPTPFTGWVVYDSSTGQRLAQLPWGVSPPNDLIGDPGRTYVHFNKGEPDSTPPVATPWWWPAFLVGSVVLVLLLVGVLIAVMVLFKSQSRQQSYSSYQMLAPPSGQVPFLESGTPLGAVLLTLYKVSPRVYYQVQQRLADDSQGGESED